MVDLDELIERTRILGVGIAAAEETIEECKRMLAALKTEETEKAEICIDCFKPKVIDGECACGEPIHVCEGRWAGYCGECI